MSDILRFSTNTPTEVTLRWDDGKRVEGRYGEQVLFTLVDDRVMYVPPIVAQRIRDLAIRQGEPFEICKAEVKNGNRRWIEWQVRKIDQPQQPVSSANAPAAAAPAPTKGQNHRNSSTNGAPRVPAIKFETTAEGALVPAPVDGRGVYVMELAMNAAAEIAQRVESRASLRNYGLHFTSEDVRAIGLTMFIQAAREGGARWEA